MLSAHVKHTAHCYLHMFIAMHILLSAHVKHTAHCYLHMLSIWHIAICTVPPSVIFYLNIINSPCVEGCLVVYYNLKFVVGRSLITALTGSILYIILTSGVLKMKSNDIILTSGVLFMASTRIALTPRVLELMQVRVLTAHK